MTHEEIEQWLATTLADVLGIEPESIEPTAAFDRLGIDSTVALSITEALGAWLGRELEPTLLYDCGSIRGVARELVGHAAE
jgi:acyl carrier protein